MIADDSQCYDERFKNVVRYYTDLYQLFSLLNGCHPGEETIKEKLL